MSLCHATHELLLAMKSCPSADMTARSTLRCRPKLALFGRYNYVILTYLELTCQPSCHCSYRSKSTFKVKLTSVFLASNSHKKDFSASRQNKFHSCITRSLESLVRKLYVGEGVGLAVAAWVATTVAMQTLHNDWGIRYKPAALPIFFHERFGRRISRATQVRLKKRLRQCFRDLRSITMIC